ncbi:N-acetylmuramoyl-L-alanine amidase [Shigella flexneri]
MLDTGQASPQAYPGIKELVIHYTADDFDVSLATLLGQQVSVHYLIAAVPPLLARQAKNLAVGAGSGTCLASGHQLLARRNAHDDTSIGIELENRGLARKPTVRSCLRRLNRHRFRRWCRSRKISLSATTFKQNVGPLSDIAPQHKDDPGRFVSVEVAGAAGSWRIAG